MKILATAATLAALTLAAPAEASVASRAMGDLYSMAGAYCPENSMIADGRLLEVKTHEDLFSILSNRYGGDGKTTFALPNLSGGLKAVKVTNGPQLIWCIVIQGNYPEHP
jgi:hypothetical protein